MSLREEVIEIQKKTSRKNKVELILEDLSKVEAKELLDMLKDKHRYQATAIAAVLKKRGYDISDKTISRYREKLNESKG